MLQSSWRIDIRTTNFDEEFRHYRFRHNKVQFGRRNYFAASVVIFTVCSFLCGHADGIWELVIFRFLQGLGGGALLVTSQTIITESYPPEKRGMAQAIYGLGVIIGPTLGPPLGGYIVDHFSWPYIFYINIPIGTIAALLTMQYVRSPKYAVKKSLAEVDFLGIGLLALAVGSLQYVLEKGQEDDWFNDPVITTLTVISVFSFFFFIWRELTVKNPIVELRVLQNGNLRVGTVLSFILGFGLYGSTFVIPLYLQSILGWTSEQAGMLMVPAALTTAFMMPIIGQILQRGAKQQVLVAMGMLLFSAFCLWGHNILTPDTPKSAFDFALILRGLAMGMLFIPISLLSLSTLKGQQIGQGAAFTGMMRQLGGSFGIALITTYMARRIETHKADLTMHLDASNPILQQRVQGLQRTMVARGKSPGDALGAAYQAIAGNVAKQAAVMSYMDVFMFICIMFLCCIPFILMVKSKKDAAKISIADAAH
ncbi:MAG: DHA2 family efflux MFS transporter permease subunit [Chitinophagia bacterium]|nr:DHA2 family efflux MFS transporter permease subunit [Chitinophagia bacterium]